MSFKPSGQPQPTERKTTTADTVYRLPATDLNFSDGKMATAVRIRVSGDDAFYAYNETPASDLGYVLTDGDELLLSAEEALALRILNQTGSTALNLDVTVYAK